MRLSISNIAWDIAEDEAVSVLLHDYKIDAIDIAPGKYFPMPSEARNPDILDIKNWWLDHGVEIVGMQALLFGTTGLNIFGGHSLQSKILAHLSAVFRIAGVLGATRLVFGSPKNRDRSGLSDDEVLSKSVDFFRRLGDKAADEGVVLCLEPNPVCYGANFMVDSAETAKIVEAVAHPSIRMQFDVGAITINQEDPEKIVSSYARLIGHVHASEPNLAPLGDLNTNHALMANVLFKYISDAIVSVEMIATVEECHLNSIERALQVAVGSYRGIKRGNMP